MTTFAIRNTPIIDRVVPQVRHFLVRAGILFLPADAGRGKAMIARAHLHHRDAPLKWHRPAALPTLPR